MTDGAVRPGPSGVPAEALIPRRNDVLAELCRAIARNPDYRAVVQDSAVRLQRYFGTSGVLLFFEDAGDLVLGGLALPDHLAHLLPRVRAGWQRAPADPDRPPVQAMRTRAIVRRDSADATLTPAARELLRLGGARTLIVLPIFVDGDPIGACTVVIPEGRPLNAADEGLLEDALRVVGIVYQRAVLRERDAEHQRKAMQAHNLAVVGELAAGVAHEINNPLSTIVHFAELLLEGGIVGEGREHVHAILEEALRAAATVKGLQVFARQEIRAMDAAADVAAAVQAIADLEKHQLAVHNVDLTVDVAADLPPVRANPAELRRVLHNLIANARHAIHETRRAGEIAVRVEQDGSEVEIVVEDTGIGLSPAVAEAMFRPFFTTRPAGEGAGLGLAMAYGMVRASGGTLAAENWGRPPVLGGTPGEGGARLVIRLATVPDAARHAERAAGVADEPVPGLAILVVEDEEQVAKSVAALLTRVGHQVTVVRSAEEAIAELGRDGARYAVIFSDYRMPGIGGEGLFEWIRATHPEWVERVLFTSGDLLSPGTQDFLARAGRPVLAKPFTLAALRTALAPFAT